MNHQNESISASPSQDRQTAVLNVEKSKILDSRSNPERTRGEDVASSDTIGGTRKITLIKTGDETSSTQVRNDQKTVAMGKFMSIHLQGSIEIGTFDSVNDVYMKYSIVAGPDWILSSGTDVGITQISRYKKDENGARIFVWNQPISISYRSYNYFGWPQIVLSIYYYDTFGNDQILGYGCAHLPASTKTLAGSKQFIEIFAPQSSSMIKQILSWIVGRKPELVDSNLFARPDCRSVLQMVHVGQIELSINITSKDLANNGYKS